MENPEREYLARYRAGDAALRNVQRERRRMRRAERAGQRRQHADLGDGVGRHLPQVHGAARVHAPHYSPIALCFSPLSFEIRALCPFGTESVNFQSIRTGPHTMPGTYMRLWLEAESHA